MQSVPQNNFYNSRKFPVFDPVDSTPSVEENEPYHLKLCFCPLCTKGMSVLSRERSRNVISWQYLCRIIFYCLFTIHKKNGYFSLKYDVHWFIVDHWYLFGQLEQFRTNPNKWKKAILDAMIHCNLFESGKNTMNKTGVWRLRKYETPWECHDNCYDSSEKQSTEVYANISNEDKDHNGKNALPSLSSLHKYTMNDINPEAMILPSLMKGLSPENNKYEDCNGFIQNLM
ncbi:Fork-head domain-containing protein [Entamoeba marina]